MKYKVYKGQKFTWCTQHMSVHGLVHTGDMAENRSDSQQRTTKPRSNLPEFLQQNELRSFMTNMLRHQITFVLQRPARWTHVPCRYHDLTATILSLTNGARCLVIMNVLREKRCVGIHFVFYPINLRITLIAVHYFIVDWIERHAEVV